MCNFSPLEVKKVKKEEEFHFKGKFISLIYLSFLVLNIYFSFFMCEAQTCTINTCLSNNQCQQNSDFV